MHGNIDRMKGGVQGLFVSRTICKIGNSNAENSIMQTNTFMNFTNVGGTRFDDALIIV